jgi:hypothetical protein
MANTGDETCLGGDHYRWVSPADLGSGVVPPSGGTTPPDGDDTLSILASIDARMARLVAIKEDDAWSDVNPGSYPYGVLNIALVTGSVKEETLLPVLARSLIIISDQSITLNLYSRNAPDLVIQKVSGTTDYQLKQLSLWSLPKSRAVDKIYITNASGSTANIQVIIWG